MNRGCLYALALSFLWLGCESNGQERMRSAAGGEVQALRTDQIRGAWLAPRSGYPLDSTEGTRVLRRLASLGVTHVAVGHDVQMPSIQEPKLQFGEGDAALVAFVRRARKEGIHVFLIPRIESPDFFRPPYPFRGDIRFELAEDWDRFHDELQAMVLHYGRLAEKEGIAILGMALELKHSVRGHEGRWRQMIAALRSVYRGKITYSANWYEEWDHIAFWDALDFIGVGAYFELQGSGAAGQTDVAELVERWQPIMARLAAASRHHRKPVLFTEVGYTGYHDCAERPWEWAGKQEKGIAIDHSAQARAWAALLHAVVAEPNQAGLFAWTFYNNPKDAADWEYAIAGRPAEDVLRRAYAGRSAGR